SPRSGSRYIGFARSHCARRIIIRAARMRSSASVYRASISATVRRPSSESYSARSLWISKRSGPMRVPLVAFRRSRACFPTHWSRDRAGLGDRARAEDLERFQVERERLARVLLARVPGEDALGPRADVDQLGAHLPRQLAEHLERPQEAEADQGVAELAA